MNQFKDWGFSAQWWRGEKGEYWVLGQTVLSVGFALLPVYPAIALNNLSPIWKYADWGLTGIFGLMALLLLFSGSLELGSNLTPLPHPKHDGALVTGGVYALVRHPIYSGVIFLAIAYSC
jgi:protein-S-isoprenylcysteine O-methyltransferase Ste14